MPVLKRGYYEYQQLSLYQDCSLLVNLFWLSVQMYCKLSLILQQFKITWWTFGFDPHYLAWERGGSKGKEHNAF